MTKRPAAVIVLALLAALGAAAMFQNQGKRAAAPQLPPAPVAARSHFPFGPVKPPRPLPPIGLTMDDGSASDLVVVTQGHWTLAQLIFTNCATTCPLQGAIFQRTQELLRNAGLKFALLSISIDPERDQPAALRRWLGTFDAGDGWRAAAVTISDVGALLDTFNGRKAGLDVHDARVYFIDPHGRLAYTSEDLPDPMALVGLAREARE